jgi:hypothetical protein
MARSFINHNPLHHGSHLPVPGPTRNESTKGDFVVRSIQPSTPNVGRSSAVYHHRFRGTIFLLGFFHAAHEEAVQEWLELQRSPDDFIPPPTFTISQPSSSSIALPPAVSSSSSSSNASKKDPTRYLREESHQRSSSKERERKKRSNSNSSQYNEGSSSRPRAKSIDNSDIEALQGLMSKINEIDFSSNLSSPSIAPPSSPLTTTTTTTTQKDTLPTVASLALKKKRLASPGPGSLTDRSERSPSMDGPRPSFLLNVISPSPQPTPSPLHPPHSEAQKPHGERRLRDRIMEAFGNSPGRRKKTVSPGINEIATVANPTSVLFFIKNGINSDIHRESITAEPTLITMLPGSATWLTCSDNTIAVIGLYFSFFLSLSFPFSLRALPYSRVSSHISHPLPFSSFLRWLFADTNDVYMAGAAAQLHPMCFGRKERDEEEPQQQEFVFNEIHGVTDFKGRGLIKIAAGLFHTVAVTSKSSFLAALVVKVLTISPFSLLPLLAHNKVVTWGLNTEELRGPELNTGTPLEKFSSLVGASFDLKKNNQSDVNICLSGNLPPTPPSFDYPSNTPSTPGSGSLGSTFEIPQLTLPASVLPLHYPGASPSPSPRTVYLSPRQFEPVKVGSKVICGQLGRGVIKRGPPDTIKLGEDKTPLIDVSAGALHSAVLTENALYTFGNNDYGQLGRQSKAPMMLSSFRKEVSRSIHIPVSFLLLSSRSLLLVLSLCPHTFGTTTNRQEKKI